MGGYIRHGQTKNKKRKTKNEVKTVILAAGWGTRLRPLTHLRPKALIPVLNRPLLGLWLDRLKAAGCTQAAVNTHHLASQVQDFLADREHQGFAVRVSHEPELLGTGGGLRTLAAGLGEEPFLAVNVDILTDLDLAAIYAQHRPEAVSTLVLHDYPPDNKVAVDRAGNVVGIGAAPIGEAATFMAYTGVQVASPRLFRYLPPPGQRYDLVKAWREALAAGERLATVVVRGHFWQDLGTPGAYLAAHRRLLSGASPGLAPFLPPVSDPLLGPGAIISGKVSWGGGVCLGPGVRVGNGARLTDTVAWEGADIAPGVELKDCIVAAGVRVSRSARGEVLV